LREDVDENDTWATMFPSLGILIVRQREGQDRAVSGLQLSQRAREKEKILDVLSRHFAAS